MDVLMVQRCGFPASPEPGAFRLRYEPCSLLTSHAAADDAPAKFFLMSGLRTQPGKTSGAAAK
jgi:hypothetical protein